MEIEELEVFDFLHTTTPLEGADTAHLSQLVQHTRSFYKKRGSLLSINNEYIYLVHKGAVGVRNEAGETIEVFAERDWFGCNTTLLTYQHICKEDTLCYQILKEEFFRIFSGVDEINEFFIQNIAVNTKIKRHHGFLGDSVMNLSRALDVVIVSEDTTIFTVAEMMTRQNTTAILVQNTDGMLSGIVTDRAMCTKVVAENLSSEAPITSIMTPQPITIQHYESGSKAMLDMAKSNIRHLPIMDNARVVGILTAADLLRKQSHNVVFLLGEVQQAKTVDELVKVSTHLPLALTSSIENNLDEHHIAYSLSTIGRAILVRLIKQFEHQHGNAPIPYAFVVAGSQARGEQILHSDQDNLIILSNEYKESEHGEYFAQLAHYVSDGLDKCGYIYCPGGIMASHPKLRVSLQTWIEYFTKWICVPDPKALLNASIFFDMKCLYGDSSLLDTLRKEILTMSQKNTIFLTHMAANALQYQPPLGFFRNLIFDKNDAHEEVLDLKLRGVSPIIDMVRVYAISHQVGAINTTDRMNQLLLNGGMSVSGATELIEAYTMINTIRIKHQAEQVRIGENVNNVVQPADISSLNKKYLKDAFKVVSAMQEAMASRYATSTLT